MPFTNKDGLYVEGLTPIAGGYFMQWGTSSFTNDATDMTIRTNLTHVDFAVAAYNVAAATAQLATDAGFALSITTSVSSGTLTVSRDATSATDATDAAFSYLLIGRKYSTD